jgi:hypothetical protein
MYSEVISKNIRDSRLPAVVYGYATNARMKDTRPVRKSLVPYVFKNGRMKREILSFLAPKCITNLHSLRKCGEYILEENGVEYHCMLKALYGANFNDVRMRFIEMKCNSEGDAIGTVCTYFPCKKCEVFIIFGVDDRQLSKKYPLLEPYQRMPLCPYKYEIVLHCKIEKTGEITLIQSRASPTNIIIKCV